VQSCQLVNDSMLLTVTGVAAWAAETKHHINNAAAQRERRNLMSLLLVKPDVIAGVSCSGLASKMR
jgi:hypothetical protein